MSEPIRHRPSPTDHAAATIGGALGAVLGGIAKDAPSRAEGSSAPRSSKPHAWDPDSDDLTTAKNAHRTNTQEEFDEALGDDFNWFEGDLRLDGDGVPVMSHDADKVDDGIELDDWLRQGRTAERGMKVDVKDLDALPKLLDSLERSGIPEGRMMINVPTLPVDQMRQIRSRFPDAWLAINPAVHEDGYHRDDIDKATAVADAVGGRVAFPVRWDVASDDVIHQLEQHGKTSIWTAKSQGTPDDAEAETKRLRERGVTGVIDLGEPLNWYEKLAKTGNDIWQSGPVRGARHVGEDVYGAAKTGAHVAASAAKGAVHAAREGASHIPVVGGLFD
jgi:hypothetical protein